jgi:GNAT superfamily N-acetyltransferase
MEVEMKKLLIIIVCVYKLAYVYAASADRTFVDPAEVVVRINHTKAKDLSREKEVYVSGKCVSDQRFEYHHNVFSGFAAAFKCGTISCATILYNEKVAGVMFYCSDDEEGCYELQYIVIGEGYQGKGIGTCALAQLEQRVKPKRMVLTALKGTETFYEKMGFVPTADADGNTIWIKRYA